MKDGILEFAIELAQGNESVDIPVVLVVGGLLITGNIITAQTYLKHHPISAGFESIFDKTIEQFPASFNADEKKGANDYIHLRDARYCLPGPGALVGGDSMFCRIKLEDVSAFSFGRIGLVNQGSPNQSLQS